MESVLVATNIPSPYQVELFNALAARIGAGFQAVYVQPRSDERLWKGVPIEHPHFFLEGTNAAEGRLATASARAELVVFSNYTDTRIRDCMADRARSGRAWCYWGERPGFRGRGWLGRLYRRWRLWPLWRSLAPIWGMGSWAATAWQREFGSKRAYFNIPYFSNLDRFAPADVAPEATQKRRILFSGSLIPRKGVDLLLEAFLQILPQEPNLDLLLLGAGKLEAALKERAVPAGDRVQFLGFRDWPELPAIYRTATFLCAPSRYDGWNLAVPEGLAAGLPVLVSDRTGAGHDLVRPEVNGWRFPADSVEPLRAALSAAAQLPAADLARYRQAALATAAAHSLARGVDRWLTAATETLAHWR